MRKFIYFLITFISVNTIASAQDTLTIEKAIEVGLENNYSIRIARNAQTIARNNNTLGNAGFLPGVNGNFNNTNGITDSKTELANGTIRQGSGVNNHATSANVLLNWTVFDGFNMFINKHKLEEFQKIGEYEARMSIEMTVSQIVANYYGIVQQEKMLSVIIDAMKLSAQRVALAKAKKEIGTGSEQALLQAMVDYNADTTKYLQQAANVYNTKSDLNRILGRDVQTSFTVTENIDINTELQLNDLLEKFSAQNVQLLIHRSNIHVANDIIGNYRSQYFPTINLFGGYNYIKNVTPLGAALYSRSNGLTYGVTASINIFNGGVKSLQVQNSRILLKSSQMMYEDTKLNLQNELVKYYNDYTTSLKVITLQKSNVELARKDVEIAMGRFRMGNISDIDVRITQQKLIDAEYNLLSAEYSAKQSEIELQRLSGQLMNLVR